MQKDRVARTLGQLGTHRQSVPPEADNAPEPTQAVALTPISRYDDVIHAIIYVPESGRWIRASRHSTNSAWSQREEDWKVREAGNTIVATGGEVDNSPDDIPNEAKYAAEWLQIAVSELAYDADHGDTASIDDAFELTSSNTAKLYDPDGREGYATFRIEDIDNGRHTAMDLDK